MILVRLAKERCGYEVPPRDSTARNPLNTRIMLHIQPAQTARVQSAE